MIASLALTKCSVSRPVFSLLCSSEFPRFLNVTVHSPYRSHRFFASKGMAVAAPVPTIVGALSCQKDSYLQTLETEVVSCTEYVPPQTSGKSKSKKALGPEKASDASTSPKLWLIEFADSVLFPEGGGQPTDHGSITTLNSEAASPIPITNIERHGLRCMHFSPVPLDPGTPVRQDVDFARRWDHMQQHTGQHVLSAIMDTMALSTLGWGMGAASETNYVELARKPSAEEIRTIQNRCNETIRKNMAITVETADGAKADSLPDDYDREKGVVRFIRIGDLDHNACCGTHLQQTAHIDVILLHHTQTVRSTNCKLFFTAGDRAIDMAASSITSLRHIAVSLSSGSAPAAVESSVQRLSDSAADARKKEKKLLADIAKYEGDRIKAVLETGKTAWSHRASDGLDFINLVVFEIREVVKERGVVVLATGEVKTAGSIVIVGEKGLVESLSAKVREIVSSAKGGGKGEKWQGKVTEWKKGELEALREAVEGQR